MLNDIYRIDSEIYGEDDTVLNYIRLTIKLLNNEDDLIEEFKSNKSWEIVLLALSFNRCDLAEIAAQNSSPIELRMAIAFLNERAFKGIEDKERAIEILKKLLRSEELRSAYKEFLDSIEEKKGAIEIFLEPTSSEKWQKAHKEFLDSIKEEISDSRSIFKCCNIS